MVFYSYLFVWLIILIGIGGELVVILKQVREKKRRAQEGLVCPKCGKKLSEDSTSCEYCGAPLSINYNVQIPVKWLYFTMAAGITFCPLYVFSGDYYTDPLVSTNMFHFLLSIVAICALVQALRLRLHWHDCMVVWAFLAILTLPRLMFVSYSVLLILTILLIVYYLAYNAITHYLNKN